MLAFGRKKISASTAFVSFVAAACKATTVGCVSIPDGGSGHDLPTLRFCCLDITCVQRTLLRPVSFQMAAANVRTTWVIFSKTQRLSGLPNSTWLWFGYASVVDAKTDLFVRLWPLASTFEGGRQGPSETPVRIHLAEKIFAARTFKLGKSTICQLCGVHLWRWTPGESNHPEKNYWRRSFSMAKPKAKHKIATGTGVAAFA